jgi:hypothetical protein
LVRPASGFSGTLAAKGAFGSRKRPLFSIRQCGGGEISAIFNSLLGVQLNGRGRLEVKE